MLINISDIHWQNIIVPFASVFAGAFFAYKFNSFSENRKNNESNFKQFNVLLNQINVVWMALLNYKIVYLLEVEKLISADPQKAVQKTIQPPDVLFKANIEQNVFLAKYNFQFLSLLSELEKQTFLAQDAINLCQECFTENYGWHAINKSLSDETIQTGIGVFELVKNSVDRALSCLLLLREKLLKCKDLYFRFLYTDNRDIFINHNFNYCVPNIYQFAEFICLSENIEKSWVKPRKLSDCIRLFIDKIYFKFISFCNFIGIANK